MATADARSCRSGPAAGAISRSGRDKVFLLSLPSWLHGLIAPPPGWGMALLDWKAQEIGIAAGLSGDPAMIADFQAGDPHMGFAIRAGLAPPGATAETPRRGSQHGQADLARQSIRDVEVRRRGAIRQVAGMGGNDTRGTIVMPIRCLSSGSRTWRHKPCSMNASPACFGWPMAVHAGTKTAHAVELSGAGQRRRMHADGGDRGLRGRHPDLRAGARRVLDHGAVIRTRRHHRRHEGDHGQRRPCRSRHRSFRSMCRHEVRWPHCLGDVRKPKAKGQAMWVEIQSLLDSGALPAQEAS